MIPVPNLVSVVLNLAKIPVNVPVKLVNLATAKNAIATPVLVIPAKNNISPDE